MLNTLLEPTEHGTQIRTSYLRDAVRQFFYVSAVLLFTLLMGLRGVYAAQNDGAWQGGFDLSPINGEVTAMAKDSAGNIVVVGNFTSAGGVAGTNNIAKWNIATALFVSIGGGLNIDSSSFRALAIDSNDNIYVGGSFRDINGMTHGNGIVKWDEDNDQWEEMGTPGSADIHAIVIDGSDDVYVGGNRLSGAGGIDGGGKLQKWLPGTSSWVSAGLTTSYNVYALAIHGNSLYAGGDFRDGGGHSDADYIAVRNLITGGWSPLAKGAEDDVRALAIMPNGNVLVGGEFTHVNNGAGSAVSNTSRIALWNSSGSSWVALGSGVADGQVNAIAISDDGQSGVIGGTFTGVGGVAKTAVVASWKSGTWHAVTSDVNSGEVHSLLFTSNTEFLAGGALKGGGYPLGSIAQNDLMAGEWETPILGAQTGNGAFHSKYSSAPVHAAVQDANGNIYIGGKFESVGGVSGTRNIAKWNGTAWEPLGTGANSYVTALAIDAAGNVYAGGEFDYSSGSGNAAGDVVGTNYIAKWNGATWEAMGTGLDNTVYALLVDTSGGVYVGGDFDTDDGGVQDLRKIIRWTGNAWEDVGGGLNDTVYALTMSPVGILYAGGGFNGDFLGTTSMEYVASWDGVSWEEVGGGTNDYVEVLAYQSDSLYIGGDFSSLDSGSFVANHIARWDGSAWHALGSGTENTVNAVSLDGIGNVFVGGRFTSAGGVANTSKIARWDGAAWNAMGTGILPVNGDPVSALVGDQNGNLYAFGDFDEAGGVSSSGIAHWQYQTKVDTLCFPIRSTNSATAIICL